MITKHEKKHKNYFSHVTNKVTKMTKIIRTSYFKHSIVQLQKKSTTKNQSTIMMVEGYSSKQKKIFLKKQKMSCS